MEPASVYISDPKLCQTIRELAAKRGVSMTQVVGDAVRHELEHRRAEAKTGAERQPG